MVAPLIGDKEPEEATLMKRGPGTWPPMSGSGDESLEWGRHEFRTGVEQVRNNMTAQRRPAYGSCPPVARTRGFGDVL